MVDTTLNYELPFPEGGDSVAVHADIERLAKRVDRAVAQDIYTQIRKHGAETYQIRSSTNRFNKAAITRNAVIPDGTGTPTSSSNYVVSDPIPVKPSAEYTLRNFLRVTYYDRDDRYISNYNYFSGNPTPTITPPEGTRYLRLSVHQNDLDTTQMNESNTLLPYEDYWVELDGTVLDAQEAHGNLDYDTIDQWLHIERSTNLFNQHNIVAGAVISSGQGALSSSNLFNVSAKIPVKPDTEYVMVDGLRATFYDADDQYLTDYNTTGGATVRTLPSVHGAHYVRLSVHNNSLHTAQLNEGETPLPYEPYWVTMEGLNLTDGTAAGDPTATNPYVVDRGALLTEYTSPVIPAQPNQQSTTATEIIGWYDNLMADHPEYITRQNHGTAADGETPLYSYTFKPPLVPREDDGLNLPVGILLSGVHGHEKAAVYILWELAKALCQRWETDPVLQTLRWDFELVFVPMANPSAYNLSQRKSVTGVDVARNLPADWQYVSDPDSSIYGGTEPLTEPEAVALYNIMDAHKDRAVVGVSAHNFSTQPDEAFRFLWMPATSQFTLNLGQRLVSRMSRKWKTEHPWITEPAPYYGDANITNPAGNEAKQFREFGILGGTFEASRLQRLDDGDATAHSSEALTLGHEALVNYIAMVAELGVQFKNKSKS